MWSPPAGAFDDWMIGFLVFVVVYSLITGGLSLKLMSVSANVFTSFGLGLIGVIIATCCILLLDEGLIPDGWLLLLLNAILAIITDVMILGIYKYMTGRNTI